MNSNGNFVRQLTICRAIASCPLPGCPLSPMTANLTESALFGSRRSCPAMESGRPTTRSTATKKRRMIVPPWLRSDRVQDVVDDEVSGRIEQQQMLADDAVLERRRQRRQRDEHLCRDRRQRLVFRILRIDLERHRARGRRVVLEDRLRVAAVLALQLGLEQPSEFRANLGGKNLA